MEALYKKLHDKYTTLKRNGFSELDEVGKDQEVKFLEYVSVSDEAIRHVQGERDRLSDEVRNLREEVASIRSIKDGECAEYKKLLMEEKQKNDMLSEEIEKLQKLLQERPCNSVVVLDDSVPRQKVRFNSTEVPSVSTRSMTRKRSREAYGASGHEVPSVSTRRMTRKCSREAYGSSGHEDNLVRESPRSSSNAIPISRDLLNDDLPECSRKRSRETYGPSGHEDNLVRQSPRGSSKEIPASRDLSNDGLPECCKITVDQTGNGDISEKGPTYCHFQALVEYIVGMKLSSVNKTARTSISALHQSSGYSFSLTWVHNASDEEPELLYHVLTLGTFETVAPEWMRSTLMFRISMCPIFFGRVSRVIRLQC